MRLPCDHRGKGRSFVVFLNFDYKYRDTPIIPNVIGRVQEIVAHCDALPSGRMT